MDTIHIPGRNGIQLRENAETASGNKIPKRVYVDNETVDIASKNGSFILKNGFMLVKGRRTGDEYGYIQQKYLLTLYLIAEHLTTFYFLGNYAVQQPY